MQYVIEQLGMEDVTVHEHDEGIEIAQWVDNVSLNKQSLPTLIKTLTEINQRLNP